VLFRIIQEPGLDEATTVKIGAPLALVVLGVIAFASARSLTEEPAEEPASEAAEPDEEEPLEPAPWEGQAPA
jgi:hypothetical protein